MKHKSPSSTQPSPSVKTAPDAAPFPAAGPSDADATLTPLVGRKIPIIGIGASAGGLEALEQFFSHVLPSSGLAYVVVQHLDPAKESLLPDLLQRFSRVPVVQVHDMTPVEANHVYVAPPGFEITLLHGVLHLLKPVRRVACNYRLIFFCARWRLINRPMPPALSCRAWAPTAPWVCAP
jgi:chemotaxis response regulator CheB